MTISSTTNRAQFNCNGSTTSFPFTFKYLADSDLQVYLSSPAGVVTLLTLNVDYEITPAVPGPGGTLSFLGTYLSSPPVSGYTLTILRFIARTQEVDFINGDSLDERNIEGMGDKLTMMVQDLDEKIGRSVLLPPSSSVSGIELPIPAAGKLIRWKATLDGFENVAVADIGSQVINNFWAVVLAAAGSSLAEALATMGLDPSLVTLTLPDNVTISDFIKTLLDDNDAAAARATLQIPAASESVAGLAELATQAEVDAGTDDARIVTPKKLKESSHLALVSTSAKGLVPTAPDKVYQALRGDGNWGGIPYVLYKSTTTVSISNSNSETTIFSVTVPANMLGKHNMVRVTILGGIVKNASGVSGIHTWRLKYGSTTVNTWTSPDAGQDSASQYPYKYEGHLFPANGSTSQQRGSWTNCLSTWWGGGSNAIMSALVDSPAGEDSTQNKTLSVTFQFNQANANIQFYVYMVLVEVLQ